MIEDLADPRRPEPAYVLPERETLEAWLEFHRTTLLLKCEALDDAQRDAVATLWALRSKGSRAGASWVPKGYEFAVWFRIRSVKEQQIDL